ncbi:MAG: hypothetical protein PUB61_09170 [Bacteroidales bacterium]|nr:hypothetical protein [Bacteroidales bacterium]
MIETANQQPQPTLYEARGRGVGFAPHAQHSPRLTVSLPRPARLRRSHPQRIFDTLWILPPLSAPIPGRTEARPYRRRMHIAHNTLCIIHIPHSTTKTSC